MRFIGLLIHAQVVEFSLASRLIQLRPIIMRITICRLTIGVAQWIVITHPKLGTLQIEVVEFLSGDSLVFGRPLKLRVDTHFLWLYLGSQLL